MSTIVFLWMASVFGIVVTIYAFKNAHDIIAILSFWVTAFLLIVGCLFWGVENTVYTQVIDEKPFRQLLEDGTYYISSEKANKFWIIKDVTKIPHAKKGKIVILEHINHYGFVIQQSYEIQESTDGM